MDTLPFKYVKSKDLPNAMSEQDFNTIEFVSTLSSEGCFSDTYIVNYKGRKQVLKYITTEKMESQLSEVVSEIVITKKASSLGISPIIRGYCEVIGIDSFESSREWIIIMDYIEGVPLGTIYRNTEVPSLIVKSLRMAIALNRDYGVLHNDLILSNIMVGTDGQVYFIDYGLSEYYPVNAMAMIKFDHLAERHHLERLFADHTKMFRSYYYCHVDNKHNDPFATEITRIIEEVGLLKYNYWLTYYKKYMSEVGQLPPIETICEEVINIFINNIATGLNIDKDEAKKMMNF